MNEQNKSLVNQAYSNFQSGNLPALMALMSDDVTWTLPEMAGVPFAGKRSGRDAVSEFFSLLGASQEAITFNPRELIADGGRVVALGSYEWKVLANGREFKGDFAHAWGIRDGKVASFDEYTDTAACVAAYQK
jgi:ketosteroid isomerase-like protein